MVAWGNYGPREVSKTPNKSVGPFAGQPRKTLTVRRVGDVLVRGRTAALDALQRIVDGKQTMTIYKPILPLANSDVDSAIKLARGQSELRKRSGELETNRHRHLGNLFTRAQLTSLLIHPEDHDVVRVLISHQQKLPCRVDRKVARRSALR